MATYIISDTHTNKIVGRPYTSERAAYAKRDKLEDRRTQYGADDGLRYRVELLIEKAKEA